MARERNPKDVAGAKKAPLHLIPGTGLYHVALALADGADKYGPFNWRDIPIEAMGYIGAIERHLRAWQDGEDCAPDSKRKHLAHAAATLLILLDAEACGTLRDDRPKPGAMPRLLASGK